MSKVTLKRPFSREHAQVQAEAKALEGALAGSWEAEVSEEATWYFCMKNTSSGIRIYVSLAEAPKKYDVCGSWPVDRNHRAHHPENPKSIRVGFQRGPDALAAEINRRLVPYLEEHWPLMLESIKKAEADEDGRKAAVEELADLLGTKPSENFKQTIYAGSGSPIYRLQVNHNGTAATIEMNCTPMKFVRKLIAFCKRECDDQT